jgi:hypothetical protein
MKKERVKVREAIVAMITADFSHLRQGSHYLVSLRRVKKELAGLTLTRETSQKELEGG